MKNKNIMILIIYILIFSGIASAQEECTVELKSYMSGALGVLKTAKDKSCFNMDLCGLKSGKEYKLHLHKCKDISQFWFDEYKVTGEFTKKQIANMLETPMENIIFMGTEDPNVFIPTENAVIIAKKDGKYYFGGKETAIKGDPWAVKRLMFKWWVWAIIIVIASFYLLIYPKLKKKWVEYKNQEDETI